MISINLHITPSFQRQADLRRRSYCKIELLYTTVFLILTLFDCVATHSAQTAISISDDRTFTDQSGQTFTLKTPYQRIISLYGAHTENLYAIGAENHLMGVGRNEIYPPDASKKPVFSYRDDAEKFLAARPDLILIRPMISRAYPGLCRRMTQSGIAVVSLQPSNLTEMYTYWRILGLLTGKAQAANRNVTAFQSAVQAYAKLSQSLAPKKRVYLEAIHSKMKTFTPDAMAAVVLRLAGGINIAVDAPQVRQTNIAYYGKERILSKADQIDVYLAQVGAMNRPTIEMICQEPGFQLIKAVQQRQVHLIDEAIISRPTPRLLTGIHRIGQILYSNRFNRKGKKILETFNLNKTEVPH